MADYSHVEELSFSIIMAISNGNFKNKYLQSGDNFPNFAPINSDYLSKCASILTDASIAAVR